jgi:polyphosphate kinase
MHRNLSRRVEVAFPIRDPRLRAQVLHYLSLQLADTRKARILDARGRNAYVIPETVPLRSQEAIRTWLASLVSPEPDGP